MPTIQTINQLTEKVLAHFRGVKRVRDGELALCPGHNNRDPSLSIKELPDKILLHCRHRLEGGE